MRGSVLSIALVLLALSCSLVGGVDANEQYPTRPITLVNPFPPGGLADLTGRPLAAALEQAHPSQRGWRDHVALFLYFRAEKPLTPSG